MSVRKLPEADPRVETGTVQFGEDWPGLFLRGKHAFHASMYLHWAIGELETRLGIRPGVPTMDSMRVGQLKALLNSLEVTRVRRRCVCGHLRSDHEQLTLATVMLPGETDDDPDRIYRRCCNCDCARYQERTT